MLLVFLYPFALVLTALGGLVWLVSAAANYSYGLTQGSTTPFIVDAGLFSIATDTAHIMATCSLAVDGLKALLPLSALLCWRLRLHGWAMGAMAIWLGCLLWSGLSSVGFMATETGKARDSRAQAGGYYSVLAQRMKDLEAERAMVPMFRPAGVVEAEIAGIKGDDKFKRSRDCTDVTLPDSRQLCGRLRGLEAELAAANRSNELSGQIDETRDEMKREHKVSQADPLAAMAASLFKIDEATVQKSRSLNFSLLVEILSSVIFTLAWAPIIAWHTREGESRRRTRPANDNDEGGEMDDLATMGDPVEQPSVQSASAQTETKPLLAAVLPAAQTDASDQPGDPVRLAPQAALAQPGRRAFALRLAEADDLLSPVALAPVPQGASKPYDPLKALAARRALGSVAGKRGPHTAESLMGEFFDGLKAGVHSHADAITAFKALCKQRGVKPQTQKFSRRMEDRGATKLHASDGSERVFYVIGVKLEDAGETARLAA